MDKKKKGVLKFMGVVLGVAAGPIIVTIGAFTGVIYHQVHEAQMHMKANEMLSDYKVSAQYQSAYQNDIDAINEKFEKGAISDKQRKEEISKLDKFAYLEKSFLTGEADQELIEKYTQTRKEESGSKQKSNYCLGVGCFCSALAYGAGAAGAYFAVDCLYPEKKKSTDDNQKQKAADPELSK